MQLWIYCFFPPPINKKMVSIDYNSLDAWRSIPVSKKNCGIVESHMMYWHGETEEVLQVQIYSVFNSGFGVEYNWSCSWCNLCYEFRVRLMLFTHRHSGGKKKAIGISNWGELVLLKKKKEYPACVKSQTVWVLLERQLSFFFSSCLTSLFFYCSNCFSVNNCTTKHHLVTLAIFF